LYSSISPKTMKETNIISVFNLIKLHPFITRREIAKKLSLSPSTVTVITEQLLAKELIVEDSPINGGKLGRRPVGLKVTGKYLFIIAVEVYDNRLAGAIFDINLKKVADYSYKIHISGSNITNHIIAFIEELKSKNEFVSPEYLGIGIAFAGMVERKNRQLVTATKMKIYEANIADVISDYFGINVYMENISVLAGMAEKARYRYSDYYVYIYNDQGIGGCVYEKGRFLCGSLGVSPEIGHLSVDPLGEKCYCGNRGCIEMYASMHSVLTAVAKHIEGGGKTAVKELSGGDNALIDGKMLSEAVKSGDSAVLDIILDAAEKFGLALVYIVNLFNPDTIVIGGRIEELGEIFKNKVLDTVTERTIPALRNTLKIEYVPVDDFQVLKGSAVLVLDNEIANVVLG